MRVPRFLEAKDLGELVDRLFEGKSAAKKRAARGVANANRHLALVGDPDLAATIPKGTLIAVPEVRGARPKDSATPLGATVAAEILKRVEATLPTSGSGARGRSRADDRACQGGARENTRPPRS
jgi:hypothetical protein